MDPATLSAGLVGLQMRLTGVETQIALVRTAISGKKMPGPKPKGVAAIDDGQAPEKKKRPRKRQMSPEGKARIAAGQKKRWEQKRQASA